MNLLSLLILLMGVIVGNTAIFFPTAALGGGHIEGDQQWQDFDKYDDNFDEKYEYQNPGYQQQYIDYQHQTYHQSAGLLRPTQTLFQATQHLLQPGQQILQAGQHLLQPGQHLYAPNQQHQLLPDNLFQHPVTSSLQQIASPFQLFNRFQNSPLAPQNSIPIVVRLVENQSVPPLRAVYTLPPFLEKLVERVQGYYSVYNHPEQLTLDRPLFKPTAPSLPEENGNIDTTEMVVNNESTTKSPIQLTTDSSTISSITTEKSQQLKSTTELPTTSTTQSSSSKPTQVSTLTVIEVTPTTQLNNEENTTDSTEDDSNETTDTTEEQTQQTTDPSNFITPDTMRPDMKIYQLI